MTDKEAAKQVIENLPDESTMDEIIKALYVKIKFAHGEKQIRDGKGVSYKDAQKRLNKWVK